MNDKPSLIQVIEIAQRLPDADLHALLTFLREELKLRYKRADQMAAMALTTKDWVETIRGGKKLPAGAKGHIVEIRRELVDVHFPEHGMFSVAASMLRRIDAPPGGFPKPASGV